MDVSLKLSEALCETDNNAFDLIVLHMLIESSCLKVKEFVRIVLDADYNFYVMQILNIDIVVC